MEKWGKTKEKRNRGRFPDDFINALASPPTIEIGMYVVRDFVRLHVLVINRQTKRKKMIMTLLGIRGKHGQVSPACGSGNRD